MNRRRTIFVLFSISTLLVLASGAWAQNLSLSIDSLVPNMGTATMADFDAGQRDLATGNTLQCISKSGAWRLFVQTTSVDMGTASGYTKPITNFGWKLSTGGAYTFFSSTGVNTQVTSGAKTIPTGVTVIMDYRCLLAYANDVPATYIIALTYTITSP